MKVKDLWHIYNQAEVAESIFQNNKTLGDTHVQAIRDSLRQINSVVWPELNKRIEELDQ